MRSDPHLPRNMSEVCRLCLSSDDETLPIFGEDQASLHRTPLPFRILACVSVEVSSQDVLPTVICKQCLEQVNQWHDFKQLCDSSQATLKQWLCQTQTTAAATTTTTTTTTTATTADTLTVTSTEITTATTDQVVIKQEPVEVDEDSVFQEDVHEVCNDSREYCMLVVKQEEIEVCEENPVETSEVSVTVDPLDVPPGRSRKSPRQEEQQHFYSSAVLLNGDGSSFEYENEGEIDFRRVNHGGAISVQGLFDSSESAVLVKKPVQPRKKRRFFKRITFKKKKKKSPPIWTPQEVRREILRDHMCRECGESFPELWLLKSHEKSHKNAENVCTICEKRFSSKGCLVRHIRLHTRQMPYSCSKCFASFANRSAYLQHRQTTCSLENSPPPASQEVPEEPPEKNDSGLSCYICQETFPSMFLLIQHRKTHNNFSCPKCKKPFSGGKALSNHLRVHRLGAMMAHKMVYAKAAPKVLPVPVNKSSTCSVCNKVFPSVGLMHRHMVKHTKLKEFTCHICNATMGYATSLHKHLKSLHNISIEFKNIKPNDVTSEDQPNHQDPSLCTIKSELIEDSAETGDGHHVCTICNKTFSQRSLLVGHVKIIHMGLKTYKCTTCGKMFPSKPHLVKHMEFHKEGQAILTCKICCKQFSDVRTYDKHKGVHTRFRCFTCGICSQSFNGINSWRAHQAMHLPDVGCAPVMNITKKEVQHTSGKYTCRLCFKLYRSRAELYEHKKMHIKLKIYSCTECKNSYNSLSTLMKHKRREHQSDEQFFDMGLMAGTYDCGLCGKSFSSSSSLSKHKLVHAELLYTNVTRVDPPARRKTSKISETSRPVSPPVTSDPFLCVPCNRSFTDMLSLKTHRGWHKRKRVNPLGKLHLKALAKMADSLPRKSASSTSIVAKVVPEKEAFWCEECNRSFKKSVNLARHYKLSQRHNGKGHNLSGSMDGPSVKDVSGMLVEVQLVEDEQTDEFEASNISANDSTAEGAAASTNEDVGLAPENVAKLDDGPKCSSEDKLPENISSVENLSANDSSVDDVPVDNMPANNYSLDDAVPNDTSEEVNNICLEEMANDSHVISASADEASLGNVQKEKSQEIEAAASSGNKKNARQKKVFECPLCSRIFKNKNALVRHKGWHSRSPSSRMKSNLLAFIPRNSLPFDPSVEMDSALRDSPPLQTQIYPCLTCGSSFNSASSLSKHKRLHLSPTPTLPVNRCLRPKESVRPPDRMLPELEVQGTFQCSTCKKYYSSTKSLNKHQKLHARKPLPVYTKPLPGADTQPPPLLPGLPKRLIPTKFHCNICGFYYRTAGTLYKHKRLHAKRSAAAELAASPAQTPQAQRRVDGKYHCEWCSKIYSSKSSLYRHRRLHVNHPLPIAKLSAETVSTPPLQNRSATPQSVQSPARQQVQTPHQCDVCKKYYSCSTSLNKHRRLHAVKLLPAPEKDIEDDPRVPQEAGHAFSCSYCSKAFSKQRNLDMHVRCHTGERPYVCDLCPQAFTRYNTLWKHKKRVHLNWSYTCTVCGRLFPFKNVLDLHILNVHQREPKKGFRIGGSVIRKAKVSRMGNYPCGDCKKNFVYLGALLTHERMYHGK
ncbi:uncharacterized protein LOC134530887 [Bacillus rossius redtenbacheri]|uniref:uncharacterized protein LOC134530887 n=1 Tax=Bacillus rossius redtenbacheri TaxID=93214 RepID=UPI002FDE29D1